jgi:dephospho-CoA kinase
MPFTLFGLTGGIACGKSTVAGFLRERGLPVVDADVIAREIVAPGTEGLARIVDAFGPHVLDATGALDRKKMGSIVFENDQARTTLERITHPRIRQRTIELAIALAGEGHALAAYEAALLVENHLQDAFRPLVVVAVDPTIQVQRVMQRDQISEEQARARVASQMPIENKIAVADHVIDTRGSFEDVRERTNEVLRAIRSALQIPTSERSPD